MVIAENPRTPTKLATEQTNAVVNIALMARRLTVVLRPPAADPAGRSAVPLCGFYG
jgi:hypothetical protein